MDHSVAPTSPTLNPSTSMGPHTEMANDNRVQNMLPAEQNISASNERQSRLPKLKRNILGPSQASIANPASSAFAAEGQMAPRAVNVRPHDVSEPKEVAPFSETDEHENVQPGSTHHSPPLPALAPLELVHSNPVEAIDRTTTQHDHTQFDIAQPDSPQGDFIPLEPSQAVSTAPKSPDLEQADFPGQMTAEEGERTATSQPVSPPSYISTPTAIPTGTFSDAVEAQIGGIDDSFDANSIADVRRASSAPAALDHALLDPTAATNQPAMHNLATPTALSMAVPSPPSSTPTAMNLLYHGIIPEQAIPNLPLDAENATRAIETSGLPVPAAQAVRQLVNSAPASLAAGGVAKKPSLGKRLVQKIRNIILKQKVLKVLLGKELGEATYAQVKSARDITNAMPTAAFV